MKNIFFCVWIKPNEKWNDDTHLKSAKILGQRKGIMWSTGEIELQTGTRRLQFPNEHHIWIPEEWKCHFGANYMRIRKSFTSRMFLFRWWFLIYLFLWVDSVILLAFSAECRSKKRLKHLQYISNDEKNNTKTNSDCKNVNMLGYKSSFGLFIYALRLILYGLKDGWSSYPDCLCFLSTTFTCSTVTRNKTQKSNQIIIYDVVDYVKYMCLECVANTMTINFQLL